MDAVTSDVPSPELLPLVAADALCTFRNILLDWESIYKHLNQNANTINKQEPLWTYAIYQRPKHPWLPPIACPENTRRQALFDAFLSKSLWFGPSKNQGFNRPPDPNHPIFSLPAFSLKLNSKAWDRLVPDAGIANLLETWSSRCLGLKCLAMELRRVICQLEFLPDACYLEWLRQQPFVPSQPNQPSPGWVRYCLDNTTPTELGRILSAEQSPLVQFFRSRIYTHTKPIPRERCLNWSALDESMLLHHIGKHLQIESIFSRNTPSPQEPPAHRAPTRKKNTQFKKALLQMTEHPDDWPLTAIPAFFHPLEIISMMMNVGWQEEEALQAIHNATDPVSPLLNQSLNPCITHSPADAPKSKLPDSQAPKNQHPDAALSSRAHEAARMMEAISLCRFIAQDIAFLEHPIPSLPLRMDAYATVEQLQQLMGDDSKETSERLIFNSRFEQGQQEFRKALTQQFPNHQPKEPSFKDAQTYIMELDALLSGLSHPFWDTRYWFSHNDVIEARKLSDLKDMLGVARKPWLKGAWVSLCTQLDPAYINKVAYVLKQIR